MIIATMIMSMNQTSLKVQNCLALSRLFILIRCVYVGQFIVFSTYRAFSMKNNEVSLCWCFKQILWELNSFLMKTLSSVLINCIDTGLASENAQNAVHVGVPNQFSTLMLNLFFVPMNLHMNTGYISENSVNYIHGLIYKISRKYINSDKVLHV